MPSKLVDNFRSVLGHFATGIVIVTSGLDDQPMGLTAQSFASLSLDPPLVLFCPSKTSTTWPKIRDTGKFCVNVLGDNQQATCQQFAVSGGNKFDGVEWRWNEYGLPIIDDCIAYVECTLHQIHDAGDHEIVVGLVQDLRVGTHSRPLLFYRGSYRQLLHLEVPQGSV